MKITLTDEEMIRQLLPNHPDQCFETLYNRYVSRVYRRCLSMTKNAEKAEDFTHDIFLKVFNKLDAFQERSSFSTWLYSIAFNYCSDQLRLAKRLTLSPIDELPEQQISDSMDGHLHEETLELVKKAMSTLTVSEQTLLQMKYEQGMSVDQIAQAHNLTISAVKMRLKRSREKVHEVYTRHCSL